MYLKYPIGYLEDIDFDQSMNLTNEKLYGKPLFIMIQADACGYCAEAKPDFQKLADNNIINCATIQSDGERESEKLLGNNITSLYPDFRGFPSYILIKSNGKVIAYEGGRDFESMKYFCEIN